MKSKAPLTLMEQLVMLLVFALAAALCLQMFVLTSQMSRKLENKDRAVMVVQNTAETIKFCDGRDEEYVKRLGAEKQKHMFVVGYDADWTKVSADNAKYLVTIEPKESEGLLLGMAEVTAKEADGDEFFSVTISWQEVDDE